MEKVQKLTVASAALLTALASPSVAIAEEVTAPHTEPSQASTQVSNPVDIAQSDLNAKTEAANQAQTAQTEAQAEVNTAKTDAGQASDAYNQAVQAHDAAKADAEQASPQKIAEIEQTIANDQAKVQGAEADRDAARQTADTAKADAGAKAEEIKSKDADVTAAQAGVTQAEQSVRTAQDVLNGTSKDAVDAELKAAETNLQDANASRDKALDAVVIAQEADQKLAADIAASQVEEQHITATLTAQNAVVKQLSGNLDTLKANAEKAVAEATQAGEALKSAEEALATVRVPESITLPDWYNVSSPEAKRETMARIANGDWLRERYRAKDAVSSDAELTEVADVKNLTEDQKIRLNEYAAQLLNGIRQSYQFDETIRTTPVTTSASAVALADKVAREYEADNWDTFAPGQLGNGHNTAAMDRAVEYYRNQGATAAIGSENINGTRLPQVTTMGELKLQLLNGLQRFMINSQELEHATNALHQRNIGVSFSYIPTAQYNNLHWLAAGGDDSKFPNANHTFKNTFAEAYNTTTLQANVDKARANLQTKSDARVDADYELSKAQNEVKSEEAKRAQIETALAQLQTKLQTLQTTPLRTPDAQDKLAQAETNIQTATVRLQDAQTAVNNYNADRTVKEQALILAQDRLVAANTKLNDERRLLAQAQAEYKTALTRANQLAQTAADKERALASINDAIAANTARVAELKTAGPRYEAAKTDLAKALDVYTAAKNLLIAKEEALLEATKVYDAAKAEQKTAQAALDAIKAVAEDKVLKQDKATGVITAVPKIAPTVNALPEGRIAPERIADDAKKLNDEADKAEEAGRVEEAKQLREEAKKLAQSGQQLLSNQSQDRKPLTPEQVNQIMQTNTQTYQTGQPAYGANTQHSLPATGDKASQLLLLVGTVAAALALATERKKRKA